MNFDDYNLKELVEMEENVANKIKKNEKNIFLDEIRGEIIYRINDNLKTNKNIGIK